MAQGNGILQRQAGQWVNHHAWKALLVVSLIISFFGATDMLGGAGDLQSGEAVLMHSLTGLSWADLRAENPAAAHLIDWKFRTDGAALVVLGLLSAAICLRGFRKGERWAWYALWIPPLWLILTVVFTLAAIRYRGYGTPVPVISGTILLLLWGLTQAASFRRFF